MLLRRLPLVAPFGLAIALAGCHAEYDLMLLPSTEERPTEPCDFEVTTAPPSTADYKEIGKFEIEFYPSHDLASLKDAVTDAVCHVGGDVVVARFDGSRINEAILYRRVVAAPGASAPSPLPGAPPTAASAASPGL